MVAWALSHGARGGLAAGDEFAGVEAIDEVIGCGGFVEGEDLVEFGGVEPEAAAEWAAVDAEGAEFEAIHDTLATGAVEMEAWLEVEFAWHGGV